MNKVIKEEIQIMDDYRLESTFFISGITIEDIFFSISEEESDIYHYGETRSTCMVQRNDNTNRDKFNSNPRSVNPGKAQGGNSFQGNVAS